MPGQSDMDELICRHLNRGTSLAEEQTLAAWRQATPGNERYYRELTRLLALAETAASTLVAIPAPPPALTRLPDSDQAERSIHPSRLTTRWKWAAAAVILLSALGGAYFGLVDRRPEFRLGDGVFSTGGSETATVTLGDASVVRLAPNSRLQVVSSEREREVTLDGTAYFAIAKMPGHPFRVRTRAGDALVLGTKFEVTTHGEDLRLVVVEGQVELGAGAKRVKVAAGEVSRVFGGTVSAPERVADPTALIGWLGTFLVFQDATLVEVGAELSRAYGVEVEILDSALRALRVTGSYQDRSLAEVANLVCGAVQARCVIEGRVVRIQR